MYFTKTYKKTFSLLILVVLGACLVSAAWAGLSSLQAAPSDDSVALTQQEDHGVLTASQAKKSHAPEPTTIALFFSGICGMVVSFVRKTYAATKRFLDICAGIVGLIVLSPLFLITAAIIRMSSKGPIFYTQERVGKDGKVFTMYKFRTMRADAEKDTGAVWAAENDNRLIPCGNFLRKAHVDEIPQFLNILKGDMSLIGPRPERPEFVAKLKTEIVDYEKRLAVKPGLTGLAQVWHRYDRTLIDVRKKIKYDLLYIKKICLWTDLRIFLRTFRVVLTGEGAH